MIKRNIKMVVTSEESKQVQEICFANEIVWEIKQKECSYTDRKFLYIDDYLTWGSMELSFKENPNEEVDAKFFIKTKGSCGEENQEFKVGDTVGVYCPHPLCGYTNVKIVGVEVDNYILEAGKDSTGNIPYQLRNKNFFVAKDKVFVAGYEQQFLLKQNLETQPEEVLEEAPEQPTEAKPKQYLVFVASKGKPKRIHQSLESAQEEAKRLCKSGLCEVMVLEVVSKYQAKVIVEEV